MYQKALSRLCAVILTTTLATDSVRAAHWASFRHPSPSLIQTPTHPFSQQALMAALTWSRRSPPVGGKPIFKYHSLAGRLTLPIGGGRHPIGEPEFTLQELEELEEHAKKSGAKPIDESQRSVWSGDLFSILDQTTPGPALDLFEACPSLHEALFQLYVLLTNGLQEEDEEQPLWRVQFFVAPKTAPFKTYGGRQTTAFTRVDPIAGEIRIYVQRLTDVVHEGLEYGVFLADPSIPSSQRHSRAFLAESIVDAKIVSWKKHTAAIPISFFEQLERMNTSEMVRFIQDFDETQRALKDKFMEGPDSHAFLERALAMSECMHALISNRLRMHMWWIFSNGIQMLSGTLIKPSEEFEEQKSLYSSSPLAPYMPLHGDNITAALSYYLSEKVLSEESLRQRLDEKHPDDVFALKGAEPIFRTAIAYLSVSSARVQSDDLMDLYNHLLLTPFQSILCLVQKSILMSHGIPPIFQAQIAQLPERKPALEITLLKRACDIVLDNFRKALPIILIVLLMGSAVAGGHSTETALAAGIGFAGIPLPIYSRDAIQRLRKRFRLIVFDLGGTLAKEHSDQIDLTILDRLIRLREKNVRLAGITARSFRRTRQTLIDVMPPLAKAGLVIGVNLGGEIFALDEAGRLNRENTLQRNIIGNSDINKRLETLMLNVAKKSLQVKHPQFFKAITLDATPYASPTRMSLTSMDPQFPFNPYISRLIAHPLDAALIRIPLFRGLEVITDSHTVHVARTNKGRALRVIHYYLNSVMPGGLRPEDMLVIGNDIADKPMLEAYPDATGVYAAPFYPGPRPRNVIIPNVFGPEAVLAALDWVLEAYDTPNDRGSILLQAG